MKIICWAFPLIAVLNSGGLALAQASKDAGEFKILMNVNLVVLQATVRDAKGRAVPELTQERFNAYEDGAAQHIRLFRHADTPVTVGIVVDHSGSMRAKLTDVTAAARAFVQASNTNDQMFVVNFNEHVTLGLAPNGESPAKTRFSDSAEQLGNAIGAARASGTTALYDAMADALQRLRTGSSDKKVLLVISDGGDNASTATLEQVLKIAEQTNAMIYAIGIFAADDPDRNPRVLQRLAHQTGGEAYFPPHLSEAVQICERIAHEIRDQYTIGYSSSNVAGNPKTDRYHKVRLTARGNDNEMLAVRTRAGYSSK